MTIAWTTERDALSARLFARLSVGSMDDVPDAADAASDALAQVAWRRYYTLVTQGAVYEAARTAHETAATAAAALHTTRFEHWRDGGIGGGVDFGIGVVAATARADFIARYVESLVKQSLVGLTPTPALAQLPNGEVVILAPEPANVTGLPAWITSSWTTAEDASTGLAAGAITLTRADLTPVLRLIPRQAGAGGSRIRAAAEASALGPAGQSKITLSLGDYREVYERVDLRTADHPALPNVSRSRLVAEVVQVGTGTLQVQSNAAPVGWTGGHLPAFNERVRLARLLAASSGASTPWRIPTDVAEALERAAEAAVDMIARQPVHPRDLPTGPARVIRDAEDRLRVEIARSAECRAAMTWTP